MKRSFLATVFLLTLATAGWAQPYISTCETVPFACPTVCPGGSITLRIFQVLRLPVGAEVQAELSNAQGQFGAGSQVLPIDRYSTNGGTTYTQGIYTFTRDVSELYARFVIPPATVPGVNYNLRIRSSSGYVSADNFRCPGNGHIIISAADAVLPPVTQETAGINQWVGHVYTWEPTTNNPINSDQLVALQNFFDPSRYQGHVLYDVLNLDLILSQAGGLPSTLNQGTSMGCGSLSTNYTMRLRRRQDFAPGRYRFTIAGDDGIRLSIDGGTTWLISSWYDQTYDGSQVTTNPRYPQGLCLTGPVDLVVEYFQHPADSRLTFKAEMLGPADLPPLAFTQQPESQVICANQTVQLKAATSQTAQSYQWQVLTDSGWHNLSDNNILIGAQSTTLTATQPFADTMAFRLVTTQLCGQDGISETAYLFPCCTVEPLTNLVLPNGLAGNRVFGRFTCDLEDFDLQVYNRWGKRVYATASPAQGWDGTGLSAGTYYYFLRYRYANQATEKRGFVELVR